MASTAQDMAKRFLVNYLHQHGGIEVTPDTASLPDLTEKQLTDWLMDEPKSIARLAVDYATQLYRQKFVVEVEKKPRGELADRLTKEKFELVESRSHSGIQNLIRHLQQVYNRGREGGVSL